MRNAECGIFEETGRSGERQEAMKNELEEGTKQFARAVIASSTTLPRDRAADILAQQLQRSGTSIGANYREAGRAQSHDDIIHKIAICEKEAAETEYWIELIIESRLGSGKQYPMLLDEVRELFPIFVASGRTAKSPPLIQSAFRLPRSAFQYPSAIRPSRFPLSPLFPQSLIFRALHASSFRLPASRSSLRDPPFAFRNVFNSRP